jgi:predicted ATPase/DNA-binding SARP family transcriptional activator
VRTEDLVTGLWRDPPASCRKIVQISVSQLRRSLGDHQLATEAHGYRLTADPMTIDLHRFGSLATHGREALGRGDAAAAAGYLTRALALWRGPALADLDEEPFVAAERKQLTEMRLAATEDRIDAELALGREHALIGELEGLVAAEPLRERPRGQLMIALYRAGRQPEALGVYQNARKALLEHAGIEPGPKLKLLERAILRQDESLDTVATTVHRTALPSPPNRLIGRAQELQHVCATLRRNDVRLLTITGPGGVGKTRVAIDAARMLAPSFRAGATFVPLDAVVDPSLVVAAIHRALGERTGTGDDLPALRTRLGGASTLLVLDSFEHLTAASTLLAELVGMAPMLKLLVTSRVSLRLSCEHESALGPLPVPSRDESDPAALAGAPAVELFLDRARAVRPELALDGTSTAAVAEICRRLDGLPLSIELAAARTKFLAPPALLARLGRRLDLLVAGPLDAPARHRTLRATVEWSYQLLSPAEQRLFARLGVFVGGCELEAAEAVCSDTDVLATLEGLAGHSLIRREEGPHTRIAMLDTLREFALDLLESTGEAERVRARHAEWYLEWAEGAEGELIGPQQATWLRRLEDDHANLIAALSCLDRAGDGPRLLRLASALWHYWRTSGYFEEARQWLSRGLSAPGTSPSTVRAKALRHAANFARQQLDPAAAERLADEALTVARTTDDVPTLAGALATAGNVAVWTGDLGRAHGMYEELLDVATASGFKRGRANATINLGSLALLEGEPRRAARICAEAVALASELGDAETKAVSLFNLGCAHLEAGEAQLAAHSFADSTRLCLEGGFREHLAYCLVGVAAVAERSGDVHGAGALLGAADALLERMGAALSPYERLLHSRTTSAVRATLAEDADRVWSEGRQRLPEQTLEAALARL